MQEQTSPLFDAIDAARVQPERLRELFNSGLLDHPRIEVFDRITAVIAKVIGAPVAFLSLVDSGRDFYLSQTGMREPWAMTRETGGRTLCHFNLLSGEPLVIEDTMLSGDYKQLPGVRALGVRAYLGPHCVPKRATRWAVCA